MVATAAAESTEAAQGWLRPMDPVQDLRAIADLVGLIWDLIGALQSMWRWWVNVTEALDDFYDKARRLGARLGLNNSRISGGGSWGSGQYAAGPQAATYSLAGPAAAPPVFVTEEQVARAVSRLLMRSDARNGRIVLVS